MNMEELLKSHKISKEDWEKTPKSVQAAIISIASNQNEQQLDPRDNKQRPNQPQLQQSAINEVKQIYAENKFPGEKGRVVKNFIIQNDGSDLINGKWKKLSPSERNKVQDNRFNELFEYNFENNLIKANKNLPKKTYDAIKLSCLLKGTDKSVGKFNAIAKILLDHNAITPKSALEFQKAAKELRNENTEANERNYGQREEQKIISEMTSDKTLARDMNKHGAGQDIYLEYKDVNGKPRVSKGEVKTSLVLTRNPLFANEPPNERMQTYDQATKNGGSRQTFQGIRCDNADYFMLRCKFQDKTKTYILTADEMNNLPRSEAEQSFRKPKEAWKKLIDNRLQGKNATDGMNAQQIDIVQNHKNGDDLENRTNEKMRQWIDNLNIGTGFNKRKKLRYTITENGKTEFKSDKDLENQVLRDKHSQLYFETWRESHYTQKQGKWYDKTNKMECNDRLIKFAYNKAVKAPQRTTFAVDPRQLSALSMYERDMGEYTQKQNMEYIKHITEVNQDGYHFSDNKMYNQMSSTRDFQHIPFAKRGTEIGDQRTSNRSMKELAKWKRQVEDYPKKELAYANKKSPEGKKIYLDSLYRRDLKKIDSLSNENIWYKQTGTKLVAQLNVINNELNNMKEEAIDKEEPSRKECLEAFQKLGRQLNYIAKRNPKDIVRAQKVIDAYGYDDKTWEKGVEDIMQHVDDDRSRKRIKTLEKVASNINKGLQQKIGGPKIEL